MFQGDSMSALLFVVALIPVTTIFRKLKQGYSFEKRNMRFNPVLFTDDLKLCGNKIINKNGTGSIVKVVKIVFGDIGMQLVFDKLAVLKMKREKQVHCEGIELGNGVGVEEADEEGYNYLKTLNRDNICQLKMKEKVQRESYKQRNVINVVNIWAAATVWYGAGIIN